MWFGRSGGTPFALEEKRKADVSFRQKKKRPEKKEKKQEPKKTEKSKAVGSNPKGGVWFVGVVYSMPFLGVQIFLMWVVGVETTRQGFLKNSCLSCVGLL